MKITGLKTLDGDHFVVNQQGAVPPSIIEEIVYHKQNNPYNKGFQGEASCYIAKLGDGTRVMIKEDAVSYVYIDPEAEVVKPKKKGTIEDKKDPMTEDEVIAEISA